MLERGLSGFVQKTQDGQSICLRPYGKCQANLWLVWNSSDLKAQCCRKKYKGDIPGGRTSTTMRSVSHSEYNHHNAHHHFHEMSVTFRLDCTLQFSLSLTLDLWAFIHRSDSRTKPFLLFWSAQSDLSGPCSHTQGNIAPYCCTLRPIVVQPGLSCLRTILGQLPIAGHWHMAEQVHKPPPNHTKYHSWHKKVNISCLSQTSHITNHKLWLKD